MHAHVQYSQHMTCVQHVSQHPVCLLAVLNNNHGWYKVSKACASKSLDHYDPLYMVVSTCCVNNNATCPSPRSNHVMFFHADVLFFLQEYSHLTFIGWNGCLLHEVLQASLRLQSWQMPSALQVCMHERTTIRQCKIEDNHVDDRSHAYGSKLSILYQLVAT